MRAAIGAHLSAGIRKVFDKVKRDGVTGLAKGVAGKIGDGLRNAFKTGLDAASDFVRGFASSFTDAMRSIGQTALSAIRGGIETLAGTAATGGLNLLAAALLAVVGALPTVIFGFAALAPAVLLAGGAAGTLFTVIAGGIGAMTVFKLGMSGVGDALAEVSENGKASHDTLKKLTPAARTFVQAWAGLQKPLNALKRTIQGKLFAGLGKELKTLGKTGIKALTPALGDLAKRLNGFAKNAFKALGKPDFLANMKTAFAGFGGFIDRISASVGNLIGAFGKLAGGSVPFLSAIGDGLGGVIDKFAAWITSAEKSGALKTFMTDAAQAFKDIWHIGGLVVGILGEVVETLFPSSKKASDSYLGGVRNILTDIRTWLGKDENKQKIRDVIAEVEKFIKKIIDEWIPTAKGWILEIDSWIGSIDTWATKIKTLADTIKIALNPIEAIFGETTEAIGGKLDQSAASMDGKGQAIGAGVAAGIRKSSPSVIAAVKDSITDKLPAYVKKALGINSPSRVFAKLGESVGEGMALGIDRSAGKVTKAVGALTAIPSVGAVPVSVAGALAARTAVPSPSNTTEYHLHGSQATIAQLEALQHRQAITARHRRAN
ncbi:hypothetical protein [Catellatospora methionotrophica]|uniref:hypothetical protein n=1 Tax=Catellatospora methionotrophica TaxID=121620 RepID=UPI0033D30E06